MIFNPHKPGSEEWHRHNLGIAPGVIGHVEKTEMTDSGILIKGWFWDPVPELTDWHINEANEAVLDDKRSLKEKRDDSQS